MMQDTILVRVETSPEDIHGMHAAKGILTARGGMTSHAAVVARGMGRPCVSGSSEIDINYEQKIFRTSSNVEVKEGDIITIDGSTGRVILDKVPTLKPEISGDFSKLMILSLIHISEPTRPLYISYAVFCLKKKIRQKNQMLFKLLR